MKAWGDAQWKHRVGQFPLKTPVSVELYRRQQSCSSEWVRRNILVDRALVVREVRGNHCELLPYESFGKHNTETIRRYVCTVLLCTNPLRLKFYVTGKTHSRRKLQDDILIRLHCCGHETAYKFIVMERHAAWSWHPGVPNVTRFGRRVWRWNEEGRSTAVEVRRNIADSLAEATTCST